MPRRSEGLRERPFTRLVFAPFPTWEAQMQRALVTNEVLVHTPPIPTYPEDLLPELQRLLAALADLDARETKREHLEEWSGPEEVKQRLLADLEQKYRATREPHASLCCTGRGRGRTGPYPVRGQA